MSANNLTLNLVEGSVSFSFSAESAKEMLSAIAQLMANIKAAGVKTPGTKTKPQPRQLKQHRQVR
jgi:hypothetical protein